VDPVSGLRWSDLAGLPQEAAETLERIADGGPFPFDRDGIVFENREGLLPDEPSGYYREYTVVTPGEDDRGARRIVTGRGGEAYYTDDHYDSFVRIRVP
jgi:ribonuclease T1